MIATNTVGNFFLALGMKDMPDFKPESLSSYASAFLTDPWILGGIALLIVWMIAQLSMFTWADLTYVLPVTASAYVLTALLGKFFLGERILSMRWLGIAFISAGVILVSETPEWTHSNGQETRQ